MNQSMYEYMTSLTSTLERHGLAFKELRRCGLPRDLAELVMERVARPLVILAWMETFRDRDSRLPVRAREWIGALGRSWNHLWHGGQTGPVTLERRLCGSSGEDDPMMLDYSVRELS